MCIERPRTWWGALLLVVVADAAALGGFVTSGGAGVDSKGLLGGVDAQNGRVAIDQAIKSFEKREFEASLNALQEAVKQNPELPPARVLFARLGFAANQAPLARAALEQAATESPAHPEVFLLFGNLALSDRRATDAAVHFEKAAALAEAKTWSDAQRRHYRAESFRGRAGVAEMRADWPAAREALEALLAITPKDGPARQRLAQALFFLDKPAEASAALTQAIKDDPTLEAAGVTTARFFARKGNLAKAGEWFEYAAKLSPKDARVQVAAATWMLEQGRDKEARAYAEAAAKLDSKDATADRLLGLLARRRKDYAEAERLFELIRKQAPNDLWPSDQLALTLIDQDDEAKRKRGLEIATTNARQFPNSSLALSTLGRALFRLDRLDEAEKALQAAASSGQVTSDTVYFLTRLLAARGQADRALPLLKSALDAPSPGLFFYRDDARRFQDELSAKAPPPKPEAKPADPKATHP